MNFRNWLHHTFNPHCEYCEARPKCESCETLKQQLERANYEKEQMLKYILEPQPKIETHFAMPNEEDPIPITPKVVPWHVRRQMLETEDRQKALLEKKQKEEQSKAIEELERNLGVVSETVLDLGDENVQSKSKQGNG